MSNRKYSSEKIRLGRIAGVLAGALLVAGCDDDGVKQSYPDVDACIREGVFTAQFCEKSFRESQESHKVQAPIYATKQDCDDDWKNCEELPPADAQAAQTQQTQTAHGGGAVVIMNSHSGYGGYAGSGYYRPHMNGVLMGRLNGAPGTPATTFSESTARTYDGDIRSMQTRTAFSDFGRYYGSVTTVARGEAVAARPVFASGTSISRGGFAVPGRGFGISGG